MSEINQLKRLAEKHGLKIRKNGEGYMVVDPRTNAVVSYPQSMPLDAIEQWLDEYGEQHTEDADD